MLAKTAAEIWDGLLSKLDFWFVFGMVAQVMFFGRFVVQIIASERAGRSVIPVSFWYLSLLGSFGLLLYGLIGRADPLFTLAYVANGAIYIRNLMLISREKRQQASAAAAGAGGSAGNGTQQDERG